MRRRSKKQRIISGILALAMITSILLGAGYGILAARNRRRKPVQTTDMSCIQTDEEAKEQMTDIRS
ncbi:MAG: hypothetical protein J5501_04730 [Ruminococcus sp.]|nr:hypothetical protein [Ruminococcus sp.]